MGRIYKKQPFSADELLQKLEDKGLIIPSKTNAITALKNIGYYRLSSYFLAFKNLKVQGKPFYNRTTTQLLMNINALQDRKDVCAIFKHHPTVIESWFSAMSATRNLCAHHSRFWNRWFSFVPVHPHEEPILAKKHSFCEQAHIITRMLSAIAKAKSSDWKGKMYTLFEKYPNIPKQKMGFILDWRNDCFWHN